MVFSGMVGPVFWDMVISSKACYVVGLLASILAENVVVWEPTPLAGPGSKTYSNYSLW